ADARLKEIRPPLPTPSHDHGGEDQQRGGGDSPRRQIRHARQARERNAGAVLQAHRPALGGADGGQVGQDRAQRSLPGPQMQRLLSQPRRASHYPERLRAPLRVQPSIGSGIQPGQRVAVQGGAPQETAVAHRLRAAVSLFPLQAEHAHGRRPRREVQRHRRAPVPLVHPRRPLLLRAAPAPPHALWGRILRWACVCSVHQLRQQRVPVGVPGCRGVSQVLRTPGCRVPDEAPDSRQVPSVGMRRRGGGVVVK
ncbi:hypothetical protein T484DRAFT_2206816, partial [Baffinella frigidus]